MASSGSHPRELNGVPRRAKNYGSSVTKVPQETKSETENGYACQDNECGLRHKLVHSLKCVYTSGHVGRASGGGLYLISKREMAGILPYRGEIISAEGGRKGERVNARLSFCPSANEKRV